ncbi:hypothetical protein HYU07_00995 [Candidatus Woesearchaeota archaeon]|nr:hypothetical protein [Candidatus Woesearchaeota archaeon]
MELKRKKGIFFTIDAVMCSSIIILGIIIASSFYIRDIPKSSAENLPYDLLNALSELKIYEIKDNNTYVQSLIAGNDVSDLNSSIIEQIGELWSANKSGKAANLTKNIIDSFIENNTGYELYIGGERIYNRTANYSVSLVSAKKIISGIAKNVAIKGYNARATATKVRKNVTEVFTFEPEGSAHSTDKVFITKKIYLNSTNIKNATFYWSMHYGTSQSNQNKVEINNDDDCEYSKDDFIQLDYQDAGTTPDTHMFFGMKEIPISCLNAGWNEIRVTLDAQAQWHTHLHPGTHLIVGYQTDYIGSVSKEVTKKVYFDNIESQAHGQLESCAWAIMPLLKPEYMGFRSATLYLHGKSIYNKDNKDNIQVYINNKTLDLTDPPCNTGNNCDFEKTYNITSNLSYGTNTIAVYLNCFPDNDFWGDDSTVLYSDPEEDPEQSSYVEYSYDLNDQKLQYGKIDLLVAEKFMTQKSTNVLYQKYFDGDSVVDAAVGLVELESRNITAIVNGHQIFKTPMPDATPSSLYIDPNYLFNGTNAISLSDVCPICYILNETLFSYKIFVPSLVGYGSTFATEEEAVADATTRLRSILGASVSAVEINNETISVGNVPSLWGPTTVEVRVWR